MSVCKWAVLTENTRNVESWQAFCWLLLCWICNVSLQMSCFYLKKTRNVESWQAFCWLCCVEYVMSVCEWVVFTEKTRNVESWQAFCWLCCVQFANELVLLKKPVTSNHDKLFDDFVVFSLRMSCFYWKNP